MSRIAGMGLRGEADFLRRYNNRVIQRQKKIKSIKLRGLHLILILFIFIMLGLLAYKAGGFVLNWNKLNITTIKIFNKPQFNVHSIDTILKTIHGNILTVNFTRIREHLLNISQIKDVTIRRKLPSTIEVRFKLRTPVFQVLVKNVYQIVDQEGIVLFNCKVKRENLITVRNIKLKELDEIIPYFTELNLIKNSINYVSLKKPYGITLKLIGIHEMFYPGEYAFADKINHYFKIRKKLFLSQNRIINVDLRFSDRFYLEYQKEVVN